MALFEERARSSGAAPAGDEASGEVIAEMSYQHPTYTTASVAAQRELPGLNDGRVAFAGAYHGWGFHEDGCASGVRAAVSLGGRDLADPVRERMTPVLDGHVRDDELQQVAG